MTQVAEGIHRLTNGISNFYLIEQSGKLVLVDAGAPRDWDLLGRVVAGLGRDLGDLDAVLLTHAHTDHTGFAEQARATTGARVWVHEDDVQMARTGKVGPRDGKTSSYLLRGAFWRTALVLGRRGATKIIPVREVSQFGDGQTLDDLARYHESTPHRETVCLDLLTDQAVRRLRQRVPHAAIDTELHPCLVHVDPAAVEHAVSNLVGNALKWTPPDAAVRVIVENGRMSVTDHGPGIADEDLPHIFERFYRAPAARGMPGAGLGLAIVGGVAQANNGIVAVQTGPHGSTFTLAFPPLPSAVEVSTGQEE